MGPLLSKIVVLSITRTVGADVLANQFIGFDDEPAGDGDDIIGICQTDAATGQEVAVDVGGVYDLIAPAAIPKGSAIQSDANGAPAVKAAGVQIGTALTTATNPGDIVKILIK